MLKGIKFSQPKSEVKTEVQTLLALDDEFEDRNYVPQKKWKREKIEEKPEENQTTAPTLTIDVGEMHRLCEEIWAGFQSNNVRSCAQKCQKLMETQQDYYRALQRTSGPADKPLPELESERMTQEIAMFNAGIDSQKSGFQPQKSAILKTLHSDKYEDKKKDSNYDKITINFLNKFKRFMNSDEVFDSIDASNEKTSKKDNKLREKNLEKSSQRRKTRILSSCRICLANGHVHQDQILRMGDNIALIIPKFKRYRENYYMIVPTEHYCSGLEFEDEVWDEMSQLKKTLRKDFEKLGIALLFFETAINLKALPHCIIEVLGVPKSLVSEIELFFRKGFQEMDSEWSVHKKLIDITPEKGGIRKQIPKNFPYFHFEFSQDRGYAHVIENEQKFNRFLHHEIMSEVLEIDKFSVLKAPQIESSDYSQIREGFLRSTNP